MRPTLSNYTGFSPPGTNNKGFVILMEESKIKTLVKSITLQISQKPCVSKRRKQSNKHLWHAILQQDISTEPILEDEDVATARTREHHPFSQHFCFWSKNSTFRRKHNKPLSSMNYDWVWAHDPVKNQNRDKHPCFRMDLPMR